MSELVIYVDSVGWGHECKENEEDCKYRLTVMDTEGRIVKEFSLPIKSTSLCSCGHSTDLSVCDNRCELICFFSHYPRCYQPTLCNPSTKQVIELPLVTGFGDHSRVYNDNFGFGYLASTNEYKLVRLFHVHYEGHPKEIRCEVCSVSGDDGSVSCWRSIDYCYPYVTAESSTSACVDEVVHWLVDDSLPCDAVLLSFDLKTEVFKTMPLNQQWEETTQGFSSPCLFLKELRGELVLIGPTNLQEEDIADFEFIDCMKLRICALKDYDLGLWEEIYTIDLRLFGNIQHLFYDEQWIRVVSVQFVRDDELRLFIVKEQGGVTIIYYNVQTKQFKPIEESGPACNVGFFVESYFEHNLMALD